MNASFALNIRRSCNENIINTTHVPGFAWWSSFHRTMAGSSRVCSYPTMLTDAVLSKKCIASVTVRSTQRGEYAEEMAVSEE